MILPLRVLGRSSTTSISFGSDHGTESLPGVAQEGPEVSSDPTWPRRERTKAFTISPATG
jgi:hypothetical protein